MSNLYDLFQNFRISKAHERVGDAFAHSRDNRTSIQVLEDKIDHLSLVCMAMCELLEEVGFNKNMLEGKIREIDLRDGKLDGRFENKVICEGCNRTLASRHYICIYCGAER